MKFIKKHSKLLVVVMVLVLIIALIPLVRGITLEQVLNYTPRSLPLAAAVLVGIYCLKSVVMIIPTYALYILGGIMFPSWAAILLAYIGLACELSLGFLLGQWLGKDKVLAFAKHSKKAGQVVEYIDGNSQFLCFITRLLPVPYPLDLGSMAFGASGMGFWRHLVFSLLGVSAVMIPLTLAGDAVKEPLSARFIAPLVISVVLAVALFFVYRAWNKKQIKEKEGQNLAALQQDDKQENLLP